MVSPHNQCGPLGDPNFHVSNIELEEINNLNSFSVCLVQGRPTIRVASLDTDERWLFDTGAGVSVIHKDLYNRMNPKPKLSESPYSVTGANKKPVDLLGVAKRLPIKLLNEETTVDVLVSPELSYQAILGMDVIRKLNIVLNPRTLKFSKIKDVPVNALALQTYRVPPMCGRPIKIKVNGPLADGNAVVTNLDSPILDKLFVPEAMATVHDNVAIIMIKNCNTHELVIPAKTSVCNIEFLHDNDQTINATTLTLPNDVPLPPSLSAKEGNSFIKRIKMNVPEAYKSKYVSLFLKNYDIFSESKSDLGSANNFEHNIRLKSSDPIYRKQFRIPEAHQQSLDRQIDDWVKMGIIEPCFSRYNSPIFIVPKKDGDFRFVLDYRALNENSLDDRYNMKDVGECIGEIGRAGSSIFSTMDLTSGFWQLPLEEQSRPLTAFTCPGKGQFCYKVLSMGLKGGPGSFQRMMELTVNGISNVIVYIDDLLAHTATHEEHIKTLQLVFNRLRNVNLKLSPDKCEFGATSVQYLGFRLTPQGILPGKDKLQAVKEMQPPTNVTEVRQFLGLCNYFRTHVKNFSTLAGPLNFLTSKKAGWRGGPLPPDAKESFNKLKQCLTSEPVVAYPRKDRQFHLYVDAATGGANSSGGFGAILGQPDGKGRLHVVAYASRSLKDHERNYTPYLAEQSAAAWAIDHFDVYLRGRKFVLYTDHKPMVVKKAIHHKTLSRLEEKMGMYDFEVVYKKGTLMPADVLSRKTVNAINNDNSYVAAAQNDTFCQDVERYLLSQTLPSDPIRARILHEIGPHLFKENEVYKIRSNDTDLIILPRSLANAAIDNAHGTLLTGHGGIDKTVARVRQLYYWPSLIVDVKQRLTECPRCQKALKSAPCGEPLHPLPMCSEPNQRIHCDLFGPLKTTDGKAHVLCITDAFTKYAEVCVVENKEAVTVAAAILSNWICRFGIPEQIFTDGGKEFSNKILNHICSFLQIAKNKTTPAHPQANAQVEIVNKSIKKYLATMTDDSLDWKPLIPTLAFAYNTTVHSTTGFSPAHLMFGYQPKYSTNMSLPDGHNDRTNSLLRHLFLNRQVATKNALQNTDKYKQRHDAKTQEVILNPGQLVFLDKRLFLNTNEKIDDKWEGPYLITKVFPNGTLDLLRKGRNIRVNKQRVKPFTAMGQVKTHMPEIDPSRNEDLATDDKDFSDNEPDSSDSFSTPSQPISHLPSNSVPSNDTPSITPTNPPPKKRGRPRKDAIKDAISNKDAIIASPETQQTPNNSDNTPGTEAVANNTRFGTHPMVLRQRAPKETISHLKIAALTTHQNINKVKRLNAIFIKKFAKHINNLASLTVLDEYALPKQVTNQSLAKQIDRRRQYLKSLCPAHRNTLLTGDPLFCFDPVVYEYVWSTNRPPLPADLRQYFEHLPDVPDIPGGDLRPLPPPPPRPSSAPLMFPPPDSDQPRIPLSQQGAIPRPPRTQSVPRQPTDMEVDPTIEFPPENIPYPEPFLPPEMQPYNPPVIPPIAHHERLPLPQPPAVPNLCYSEPNLALMPPEPDRPIPQHDGLYPFPPIAYHPPYQIANHDLPLSQAPMILYAPCSDEPIIFPAPGHGDNALSRSASTQMLQQPSSGAFPPSGQRSQSLTADIPCSGPPVIPPFADNSIAPDICHQPQPLAIPSPPVPPSVPSVLSLPSASARMPPPAPPPPPQASINKRVRNILKRFPSIRSNHSSSQPTSAPPIVTVTPASQPRPIPPFPPSPQVTNPAFQPAPVFSRPQPPLQPPSQPTPAISHTPNPAFLPAPVFSGQHTTQPRVCTPQSAVAVRPPSVVATRAPVNPPQFYQSPNYRPPIPTPALFSTEPTFPDFVPRRRPFYQVNLPQERLANPSTQRPIQHHQPLALPAPAALQQAPVRRSAPLPESDAYMHPLPALTFDHPMSIPSALSSPQMSFGSTLSTPQMSFGSTPQNSMSFGSTRSTDSSMPSLGDPMEVQQVLPFSGSTGAQFSDLRTSASSSSAARIQPLYNFSGFRNPRTSEAASVPTAPRFGDSYQQPFVQWPAVRTNAPMPPPSAGTFDNLRISEPLHQLPPPYSTAQQPTQAFQPVQVFERQPSIVHRRTMELRPAQPPTQPAQPAQRLYPMVPASQELQPHQNYHYAQSDSSVDAIQINAMTCTPIEDYRWCKLPLLPEFPVPSKLTIKQKIRAFFGNDKLLALHAHRQAQKQRYKRF